MRFRIRFAHILFYAAAGGERAITKMPRSAPIKAHSARRTAHSYSTNAAQSESEKWYLFQREEKR